MTSSVSSPAFFASAGELAAPTRQAQQPELHDFVIFKHELKRPVLETAIQITSLFAVNKGARHH
ncbi:hypothetical protein CWS02_07765 [Enterobacter sp. EA-1]|nr:hypothetical protein CWS02_07765 [Enterobacter sp. EA-1]